ncbi:MAG: aminopeptidase [Acidobacteriota bacterium]|nr:aminopeptidase [Acidobacteriota bacterium]
MNWKIAAFLVFVIGSVACQDTPTNTSSTTTTTTSASSSNVNTAPALSTSDTTNKTAPPTDLQQLAQRIVTQSAGVKEGEIVLVNGGTRDMELLENIVIEIRKVGGHPLLDINSERMAKRSYAEVPEKYDTQEPKLGMALAKVVNVAINVDSTETEGLLADVPPARMAARAKAGAPVGEEFIKNKIRSVSVGNDLYPTEWRAKRFDMPVGDFARLFWDSVNVDYTNLQAIGEKARAALAGKEMEITHPNGTSLKLNIDSRPAYISDGIISADDVSKGNLDVFLPAGEAAIIPAANTGDGKVVIEKHIFNGKEIRNLTLTFEKGKLVSMTGEGDGFAAMKADFDAREGAKDVLSYVDLGINPNYKLASNSKLGNWISAGMVTLGTGNNQWAGGSNKATGAVGGHLPGATVKVDGKVIVENGVLKI